jgi:hypothetical protein
MNWADINNFIGIPFTKLRGGYFYVRLDACWYFGMKIMLGCQ